MAEYSLNHVQFADRFSFLYNRHSDVHSPITVKGGAEVPVVALGYTEQAFTITAKGEGCKCFVNSFWLP